MGMFSLNTLKECGIGMKMASYKYPINTAQNQLEQW
jgi:hypothetical protein